jgi:hypothetical protein
MADSVHVCMHVHMYIGHAYFYSITVKINTILTFNCCKTKFIY